MMQLSLSVRNIKEKETRTNNCKEMVRE